MQEHQRSTEHLYCSKCNVPFKNMGQHITHVRDGTHQNLHHCCDCARDYSNQETLNHHCCECDTCHRNQNAFERHISSRVHKRKIEQRRSGVEHKCKKCKYTFELKKELKKHVRLTHPTRHIRCPVGEKCTKNFKTPSGLMVHLESGSCSSKLSTCQTQQLVVAHECYKTSLEALETAWVAGVIETVSAR